MHEDCDFSFKATSPVYFDNERCKSCQHGKPCCYFQMRLHHGSNPQNTGYGILK